MKKIFIATVFIFTLIFGHSQNTNSIGIKSGLTFATQDWKYNYNIKQDIRYKTGLFEALTFDFFNGKHFSLITDLSYTQKGFKEIVLLVNPNNPEVILGYSTINTRFDFITLSPMLKFRMDYKSFSPYIIVGPRVDYYISYNSVIDFSAIVNKFNNPVFGLTTGIGVEYKKNKIGIIIEGQYLSDFTYLYQMINLNSILTSIENKAYVLTLGVRYYFKKVKP